MKVNTWNKKRASRYESLRKMIDGLRAVASGEVLASALTKFEKYLHGRVKGELKRHRLTGLAHDTARVELGGQAVRITLQRYRRYIKWSFRKGTPVSALKRGEKIFLEEMQKAVKGGA